MAASPFKRRSAKTMRNLAVAEAALALARDRVTARSSRSRRPTGRLLLLTGALGVAGAVALRKRDQVAGLLPSRSSEPEPVAPPRPAAPQPSNYDAPGPPANTATPIAAPDPQVLGSQRGGIDEAAEEAAAAAEAAAIGGGATDYAGPELGERADAAHRPLAESGEGEAEGLEQAEADLAENATYRDAGMSDAERQLDDVIEQADQPQAGETPEPLVSHDAAPAAGATDADAPGAEEAQVPPAPEQSFLAPAATPAPDAPDAPDASDTSPSPDAPPSTDTPAAPPAPEREAEENPDDWRTWSGRSVNP